MALVPIPGPFRGGRGGSVHISGSSRGGRGLDRMHLPTSRFGLNQTGVHSASFLWWGFRSTHTHRHTHLQIYTKIIADKGFLQIFSGTSTVIWFYGFSVRWWTKIDLTMNMNFWIWNFLFLREYFHILGKHAHLFFCWEVNIKLLPACAQHKYWM